MCYLKLFVFSLLFLSITAAAIQQNLNIFQRYHQTLNNSKILPFISECIGKPTKASEMYCSAYFDMLNNLNTDPTVEEILETLNLYTNDVIVEGFCVEFKELVPKTSNNTIYQKFVEQFYRFIVEQDNCKSFCIEIDSDLKNIIKPKCIMLSYGYKVIRNSALTKPLDDKTVMITNPSNVSTNVVNTPKPDTNSIVQPEANPIVEIANKIKEDEQVKNIIVHNPKEIEEHSKELIQTPIKKVTDATQVVLGSEDVKPINTVLSSSEKTEKKDLVEPPTEDLDSILNQGNDSKFPEQIDPNEMDDKNLKPFDETVTDENIVNLDENVNNNPFDSNGKKLIFSLYLLKVATRF